MSLKPTVEQAAAIDAFQLGRNLKVNAYAGTGKTSTLQMMAESVDRKGTYIAFNRSIADEAGRRFPASVKALTSHALAYRSIIQTGFSSGKMTGKLNANAIAQRLNLSALPIDSHHRLSVRQHAHVISETIRLFTQSDMEKIGPELVPMLGSLAKTDPDSLVELRKKIADVATGLWEKMISPKQEEYPLGHDGYFKLWANSMPQIPADYMLLDEAQDSNPALLKVLLSQTAQVVFVGDRFQQIYAWRGAVNAMDEIHTDHAVELTQSFRFGREIAEMATKVLRLLDPAAHVGGFDRVKSKIGCSNPDAILSRTNASLIGFVLGALNAGRKPHIVGGTRDLRWLLGDVSVLKSGNPGTHPEFFGFNNWHEIEEFSERKEGEHLRTFVKIVRAHGEQSILSALDKTANNEGEGDLVLSTAHRAKGREWPRVMLDDDFFAPRSLDESKDSEGWKRSGHTVTGPNGLPYDIDPEELRLLYVACTRAQQELQIPHWCSEFFGVKQDVKKLILEPKPTVSSHSPGVGAAVESLPQKQPSNSNRQSPKAGSGVGWLWWVIGIVILFLMFGKK